MPVLGMVRPVACTVTLRPASFDKRPLIGGHAESGIALEILDRGETLARGKVSVFNGYVVVEFDPDAAFGLRVRSCRMRGPINAARRAQTRFLQGCGKAESAICGLYNTHVPGAGARDQSIFGCVQIRLAAGLAVELDGGRPADRHQ